MKYVRQGDRRSNQIQVARPAGDEFLLFILNGCLYVRFLDGSLQKRVAETGAVDLLQCEILREVVVEGHLSEKEESRRKEFVPLSSCMIESRLGNHFRHENW